MFIVRRPRRDMQWLQNGGGGACFVGESPLTFAGERKGIISHVNVLGAVTWVGPKNKKILDFTTRSLKEKLPDEVERLAQITRIMFLFQYFNWKELLRNTS